MNESHNWSPLFGDWSAFAESECHHLTYKRHLLQRVDTTHLERKPGCIQNIVLGTRGFKTDRITRAAMNAYARNTPYLEPVRLRNRREV